MQRCNKLLRCHVSLFESLALFGVGNLHTHTRPAWESSFKKLVLNTLQDEQVITKPATAILCHVVVFNCFHTTQVIQENWHQACNADTEAAKCSWLVFSASSFRVSACEQCARQPVRNTVSLVTNCNIVHTTACIAMHLEKAHSSQSPEIN